MSNTKKIGEKDFFWEEDFENFTKEKVKKYDFGINEYKFNQNLYDPLLIQLLSSHISSKQMRILDAGGGTGKWSVFLAKLGHQVELLDISEPMLEMAEENIKRESLEDRINIVCGSIDSIPYDNNSFDFIISERNPISHCGKRENAYRALSELSRVLKPSGSILGCVLNKYRKVAQLTMDCEFDRAIELFENGYLKRGDCGYSYYFGLEELKIKLIENGFTEPEIVPTTAFSELIPTAWLLDSIPIKKLFVLEEKARRVPELTSYGVRFHFSAKKDCNN